MYALVVPQLSDKLTGPIYKRGIKHPTIILEVVGSHDHWICHFSGVAGSNNAINVLNQSSLFVNIIKGHTPEVIFTVNRNEHHKGYYLINVIYPSWSVLMKGVPLPEQEKHKIFSTKQSTLRKDVKCAFGLLKKRFNILVIPD
jgi:hypothetical protein